MTSMTSPRRVVTVGVDTHRDVHHAAVIDEVGRPLDEAGLPATPAGYRQLLAWADGQGEVAAFGVEGTGAYGAGLARHLRATGQTVIEVDRPDRKTRDRKSTRLNSSHANISYAVFCLKKKKKTQMNYM